MLCRSIVFDASCKKLLRICDHHLACTRGDVLSAHLTNIQQATLSVLDAGTREVMVTYPEELLHEASNTMLRHTWSFTRGRSKNPRRVIGYLGRQGIMAARLNRMEEEHVREPGWIGWPSRRNTS